MPAACIQLLLLQTGKIVAIKKIRLGKAKEGVNVTALREIKLLKELHSPQVVQLLDVFPHKRNLSLVNAHSLATQRDVNNQSQCMTATCALNRCLSTCKQIWKLSSKIAPLIYGLQMSRATCKWCCKAWISATSDGCCIVTSSQTTFSFQNKVCELETCQLQRYIRARCMWFANHIQLC